MTSIHLSTAMIKEIDIISKRKELKKKVSKANKIESVLFISPILIAALTVLLSTF